MKRVAALDCGTNSLRLLVADLDLASGEAFEVDRRTTIVRLGQDVDRTGAFAPEALARTFATVDDYASAIDRYGVGRDAVRFVATSAARDVSNREDFVRGVAGRLGVQPDIISGAQEAWLSYDGATRGLVGRPELARPVVVVDIGGGSTEVVTVTADGAAAMTGRSLDIGSVRMTERHLHSDPPTRAEAAAVIAEADKALDELDPKLSSAGTLIGVAGTITTVAAMALRLPTYDRERTHHAQVPASALLDAVDRLVAMSVAQRTALGFMQPGRADVIGGGALILAAVVRRLAVPSLLVSEHDILDGIAWSLA
ncbi:MAG: Ppx/GppA phosphatase family protein [Nocardioidaceae bacterium]